MASLDLTMITWMIKKVEVLFIKKHVTMACSKIRQFQLFKNNSCIKSRFFVIEVHIQKITSFKAIDISCRSNISNKIPC